MFSRTGPVAPLGVSSPGVTRLCRCTSPDGHTDATISETVTETTVFKKMVAHKPTYKQNWPAYNLAQTQEKSRFQVLLHELCQGIEEPTQEKGRPRALASRHGVLGGLQGLFHRVLGRRFQCDLNDACERGHIEKAPHYNTIFKYLEMADMTPILKAMIARIQFSAQIGRG